MNIPNLLIDAIDQAKRSTNMHARAGLIEQQFHNVTPEQQDYYEHTGTGPEKHKLAVSQPCKGQISLHYFSCDSHCFLLQLVTRTFRIIS